MSTDHRFLSYYFDGDSTTPYARSSMATDLTINLLLWVEDLGTWANVATRLSHRGDDVEEVANILVDWLHQIDAQDCRSVTFSDDTPIEYWERRAPDDPQVQAALDDLLA